LKILRTDSIWKREREYASVETNDYSCCNECRISTDSSSKNVDEKHEIVERRGERDVDEVGGYESVDEGTSSVGIRRTISGFTSIGVYSCSGSTSCVDIGIHGIRGNRRGDRQERVSLDRWAIFSSSGRGIVKGLDVNERST
jgi:hypothetical protein